MSASRRRLIRSPHANPLETLIDPPSTSSEPGDSESIINATEAVTLSASHQQGNLDDSRLELTSNRNDGFLQTRYRLYNDLSNKSLPPENTELLIQRLEKRADVKEKRSYVEGVALSQVIEAAVTLRVGLIFMPGADKAQVNKFEETNMAGGDPDQKDAVWRVNTAGSLLMNLNVSSDLAIMKSDQTADIAKRARHSQAESEQSTSSRRRERKSLSQDYNAVTIDSQCIKIVNDLRIGVWDLESTLIEVDFQSLWILITQLQHLIAHGGPEMSFEETKSLIEVMIENARRMYVRSPILFRMSTRSRIINSSDIRYGVNERDKFQTITTSKGIREIITLSASYFNSLDPTGTRDNTQRFIRPRFLQMIVLLLSLLSESDLLQIADFLESTYQIRADRQHLELLFLKVLPLMSINSKVFIKALVPPFEGYPLPTDDARHYSHYWNTFIKRILPLGYLLPGNIDVLGRDRLSWVTEWPNNGQEIGFKSTQVFNNLQYAGNNLRTMNDIPPIEIHPENSYKEVTIIMNNGNRYRIDSKDLEGITCLARGTYIVAEATQSGRRLEFVIQENDITYYLSEAVRMINDISLKFNSWLAARKGNSISLLNKIGRRSGEFNFIPELPAPSRITQNMACLGQDLLAVVYKVNGRSILKVEALRAMTSGCREAGGFLNYIQQRLTNLDSRPFGNEKQELRQQLDEVRSKISVAEGHWRRIESEEAISDEPIARVLYPGGIDFKVPEIWNDYTARVHEDDKSLIMEARRSIVSSVAWLAENIVEVSLEHLPSKYFLTPLGLVEEGNRSDEIKVNDIAVLAGQYMIIANPDDRFSDPPLTMVNYLKVTSIEEPYSGRRGRRRAQLANFKSTIVFR